MFRFSSFLFLTMVFGMYAMEVPAPSEESSEELVHQIEIKEISEAKKENASEKKRENLFFSASALKFERKKVEEFNTISLLRKESEKSNIDIKILSSNTSASEADSSPKKHVCFDSSSRSNSYDSSLSHSQSSATLSSPRLSGSTEQKRSSFSRKISGKSSKHLLKKSPHLEYKPQRLIEIYKNNNTEEMYAATHPDLNTSDEDGRSLLIIAIQNANVVGTEDLLGSDKIDVNQTDKWGNTPLHHAALKSNSAIIKLLLFDYRVEVLVRNKEKYYPSQYIRDESSPEIIALRPLFFVRGQYEGAVNKEIDKLKKQGIAKARRDVLIAAIKKRVEDDAKKQDQPLPDTVKLKEELFTDEFISRLILCRGVRSGVIAVPNHKIKK